jgi:uncharacterized surface protein with fasciclin (FAS1) repeats
MRYKFLGVAAIAGTLALGAAACSSSGSSAASAASPKATGKAPAAQPAASTSGTAMAPFGPGCASVPASGKGSFTGMSTTLVTAVTKAGLVDTLNSAPGITVFAPDNAAFAKIPTATLNSVLGNKAELTKILSYHVASGHITPAELASGKPIKTLEGSTVMPSKMGSSYEVNSVPVVCGNVQTANATVYIIGSVLMPPTH